MSTILFIFHSLFKQLLSLMAQNASVHVLQLQLVPGWKPSNCRIVPPASGRASYHLLVQPILSWKQTVKYQD